ncbi:hypothetical protein [Desulfosporosinus sp. FKA]|uniref:hypothetical protein n=1 Tax=Desulfosporosinus sp. FKA TaxID=1969834 RepID=UPI000B49975D|nr:hypothetical protein [Desulfosporosinus sp. FKA]
MINGIKIMNLEGSDILKNNLENRPIYKEYNGVFTNSLLQDELTRIGLKISDKETSRDIVTVQFNYNYIPELKNLNIKDIEKLQAENENIKEKIKSLEEQRKVIMKRVDKKPIIEQIKQLKDDIRNNKIEINSMKLDDENKKEKAKMDVDSIREKLYKDGFTLEFEHKRSGKVDKIEYVFWYRTPSKSRVGDAVFINKKLINIRKWQRMGLELPEGEAKVVEMAAYEALTASNIVDRIKLDPYKNILVVNDLKSFFKTNCAIVRTNDKGQCYVDHELHEVSNIMFDGQALLDDSLWDDIDNSSFKLLRQHFFKACAFRTYIKKFMMDSFGDKYDSATVKDRYGNHIRVSEILLITTENAMKWEKFIDIGASYDLWKQKVFEDGNVFGVCKTDHISKYNNLFGDGQCYQRMSYQMVNTLYLEPGKEIDEVRELLQDTVRFIERLKNDNEYFLQYLDKNANEVNANQMVIDLYRNVKEFDKSKFFRDFKAQTIFKYVKTVRNGKVLCSGDNLTIVGNPYLMLLHSIGQVPVMGGVVDNNFEDVTLPVNDEYISVYAPLFDDGEYLASFRNPHNSPNNTGYNRNYRHLLMNKYFNFNNNIMAVNMVRTEEQDLKNGEDQDSDFCYVTNNRVAVKSAKRVFRKFPCIVNDIDTDPRPWVNDIESLITIDNELAKSKDDIGESSNLAQLAMSWYWGDESKILADIVCIMSVLAQVAIDNSKRKYGVKVRDEIERISRLKCIDKKIKVKVNKDGNTITKILKAKPLFWKYINEKVNDNNLINCYDCPCPMSILQAVIDADVKCGSKNKDTIDSVKFVKIIDGKADDRQKDKIEAKIKEYDDAVKEHNSLVNQGLVKKDDEKWKLKEQLLQKDVVNYICGLKIKPKTMQILISKALSINGMNSKYKRKLLNGLYCADIKKNRNVFMNCFK